MRILTVALTFVLISSALVAVAEPRPLKPAHEGPSVEDTLQYLNDHLYITPDTWDSKCRDKVLVSLSDNRAEMLLKYVLVDRKGRIMENVEPEYIYHVPVAAVRNVYLSGPWTTMDRVVVKTQGSYVMKIGPVWDCKHNRLNKTPRKRFLDAVELKIQDADEGQLDKIAKALNHAVELLKAEQEAKAAQQGSGAKDSLTDHK